MTIKVIAESVELNHRIRRLLALIRSIAVHMQIQDRDAEEAALHWTDRLGAIGRAALTPIAAGMDLESLVLNELLVHRAHHSGISVDGPEVRLNAKAAEFVGLLIHELVTNSVKFGALSQSRTQLRVVWWFTGHRQKVWFWFAGREASDRERVAWGGQHAIFKRGSTLHHRVSGRRGAA
jgi:two-component sensor histidine kinase